MFKEGNLLKFSPFIFKNGACPKNKFFVVLKEAENAMIMASLPTSKDHVPADMQLQEGCMEIPDRQINIYIFLAKQNIAIHPDTQLPFSFNLNTFIYGADIDSYPVTVFQEQIENGETKVELMGRLTEEQFSALKDCLKGSKMTKRRFKRML